MVEALNLRSEPLEGLEYRKEGPVAVVTIDRQEKANSLTARMHAGLRAIWQDAGRDPAVLAVVLSAAGERFFCTGADVGDLAGRGTVSAGGGRLSEELFYTARQNRVWKPVVCAVNGLVAAAGLHFVTDADIVVASEAAAFTDTHVNVGMVGAVENVALTRRLPLGSVLRLTLMGRQYRMTARRAYELGLVDEVVPAAELMDTALGIAAAIASNSPTAVARSLQVLWGSLDLPYGEAMEQAWEAVKTHRGHPDAGEGPRAFLEKRPPRWSAPETSWT